MEIKKKYLDEFDEIECEEKVEKKSDKLESGKKSLETTSKTSVFEKNQPTFNFLNLSEYQDVINHQEISKTKADHSYDSFLSLLLDKPVIPAEYTPDPRYYNPVNPVNPLDTYIFIDSQNHNVPPSKQNDEPTPIYNNENENKNENENENENKNENENENENKNSNSNEEEEEEKEKENKEEEEEEEENEEDEEKEEDAEEEEEDEDVGPCFNSKIRSCFKLQKNVYPKTPKNIKIVNQPQRTILGANRICEILLDLPYQAIGNLNIDLIAYSKTNGRICTLNELFSSVCKTFLDSKNVIQVKITIISLKIYKRALKVNNLSFSKTNEELPRNKKGKTFGSKLTFRFRHPKYLDTFTNEIPCFCK
jgi:hypothetical protein